MEKKPRELQALVDKEIETYDPLHERHFIDMYLTKMKEEKLTLGMNSSFTCEQYRRDNSYIHFINNIHMLNHR